MPRVLGRIRLSRLTDESTSAARQREIIQTWADQNEHEVVGWAEDLDVSGAVDPFDTPSLGPWLAPSRLNEWDVLCAWKLDRLARRAVPLHRLFGLCQDEGKTLVCVSDNIDLSHWVGRLIASVIAGVAEGELEAIRERTTASHRKLRELGRWPGGKPAYGYRAVEREDAAGWELVPDEHSSAVLTDIIDRILEGQSATAIAKTLTDQKVLCPSDYIRQRNGEPIRGDSWHSRSIYKMLRSKTLLGHVTHNGVTVRDADGVPVRKGPELISRSKYDQLQSVLASRAFAKTNNRTSKASPLLGVLVCKDCEALMYHRGQTVRDRQYRYYRCPSKHSPQIQADIAEELVEETFLRELGDHRVQERIFIQAEDHQSELEEALRAVEELTSLMGTITSNTMRSRLTGQLRALDGRICELESLPARDSYWEYREINQTYAEVWGVSDTEGRRQLLLRAGITARAKLVGKTRGTPGSLEFELHIPDDVRSRMSA